MQPSKSHHHAERFAGPIKLDLRIKSEEESKNFSEGRSHRGLYAPKLLSQTLFTGLAHFYALAPFGVQDLVGAYSPTGVRVEDAVDHISTSSLTSCVSKIFVEKAWGVRTYSVQSFDGRITLFALPPTDVVVVELILVLLRKTP